MQRFLSRLSLTLATCVVSLLIAVIGIGFLAAALYLAIQDVTSPAIAALSTGAAAFVLAGLVILVGRLRMGRGASAPRPQEPAKEGVSQPELAADVGQLLGAQITPWVRNHAKSATALALVAGFAVGASPELRNALRDVFKRSI